jgi:predicted transporter
MELAEKCLYYIEEELQKYIKENIGDITADFIEDYLNMEYSVIFGGMMVVLAFVFMTIAFFLPTLATTLNAPISELELISISKIVVLLLGALVLAGIGVVLKKRNNRLV